MNTTTQFRRLLKYSRVGRGCGALLAFTDAGEDPRFIARRLVILASEDIGMADSRVY